MSHLTTLTLKVLSLQALAEACEVLGLEFVEGVKTFKCFARPVGSGHVFAEGFGYADWGKCDVGVIRVKGAASNTYEIGVSRCRDGSPGYVLLYDYWQNGYGLIPKVGGNDAPKLKQEYGVAVALRQAKKMGLRGVRRVTTATGAVKVVGVR